MTSAVGPAQRARIGALSLATTLLIPIAASVAVSATLREQPMTENDVGLGMAWVLFGTRAMAGCLGLAAVFLLTAVKATSHPEAGVSLRITATVRTIAEGLSLALLYLPKLVIWQSSLALALVDVVFTFSLLRFLAALDMDRGKVDVAKSTMQYAWLYGFMRLVLVLVWALPADLARELSPYSRALGPIVVGVVIVLLLRAAALLRATPAAATPEA